MRLASALAPVRRVRASRPEARRGEARRGESQLPVVAGARESKAGLFFLCVRFVFNIYIYIYVLFCSVWANASEIVGKNGGEAGGRAARLSPKSGLGEGGGKK